ncbi:MAG: hypothetical protein MJ157_06860, partial [Clostridia bacterium]|nr:hypothetical protein [Clostridia bacterium]
SMASCGLLAGLGQGWGKKAVLAGLVLAQMVLWAYNGVEQEVFWRMGETLLAVGVFLLLPTQKITGLAGWSQGLPQRFSPEAERQIRLASQESLQAFGRLGQKIASLWLEDSSEELALEHQIIQREVRNKVCLGCGMLRVCWKDTWFRFADFLEAFRKSEENFIHYDQLPLEIQQRCLRSREVALLLACLQDNFQVSRFWQNKLKNCRRFLKEQLEIIGEIWENRLARLDFSAQAGEQAESFCKQLLRDNGFPALQVEIFNQQQGTEIAITAKSCGQNSLCRYQAAAIVSKLFNCTYQVAGDWCYLEENSHCRFWLAPELKFYWQVGAAQKSLNGV